MKFRKTGIILFSGMLILLFTAFGCKNDEEDNENANVVPQQPTQVTYDLNSGTSTTENTMPESEVSYDAENTNEDGADNTNAQSQDDAVNGTENTNTNEALTDPERVNGEAGAAQSLAEKIVEIYGSYTNKGKEPYSNLKDIEVYATESFKSWLENMQEDTLDPDAAFYGITTKTLSSAVLESTPNSATILVTTKREEITETSQASRTFYAMILVEMVKEGDEWKVNSLYWQD